MEPESKQKKPFIYKRHTYHQVQPNHPTYPTQHNVKPANNQPHNNIEENRAGGEGIGKWVRGTLKYKNQEKQQKQKIKKQKTNKNNREPYNKNTIKVQHKLNTTHTITHNETNKHI